MSRRNKHNRPEAEENPSDVLINFKESDLDDGAAELWTENRKLDGWTNTLEHKSNIIRDEVNKWKKKPNSVQPECQLLDEIKPLLQQLLAAKDKFDEASKKLEALMASVDVTELQAQFHMLYKLPSEERDVETRKLVEASHEMSKLCVKKKSEVLEVKESVELTKQELRDLKKTLKDKCSSSLRGLSDREANLILDQFVRDNIDVKKILEM